jgi:hypothetical protein
LTKLLEMMADRAHSSIPVRKAMLRVRKSV